MKLESVELAFGRPARGASASGEQSAPNSDTLNAPNSDTTLKFRLSPSKFRLSASNSDTRAKFRHDASNSDTNSNSDAKGATHRLAEGRSLCSAS